MEINHKLIGVEGSFDTIHNKLVAVEIKKYGEILICAKANMNIPLAKIQLHSRGLAVEAEAVREDAFRLAEEICRRFNEFPQNDKK